MNNHADPCWVNFDSAYRNYVFTYERSIKLPQGKGCLGYPRPYNWALSPKLPGAGERPSVKTILHAMGLAWNIVTNWRLIAAVGLFIVRGNFLLLSFFLCCNEVDNIL